MGKPVIRSFLLVWGLVLFAFGAGAQVEWLDWEEAMERMAKEPRKLLVDVYTSWCGWCKRMDATTFSEPLLSKYINERFYPVKLNAEDRQALRWKGKIFEFVRSGKHGYHALAAELTRGRLSFPTIVFLDERLEVIQPIPGYKDAMTFEQIATYFGENAYKRIPWEVYQRNYVPLARRRE